MVFEKIAPDGFEQVVYCQDKSVGLRAIIALHSTVLGPATGGARLWNYPSEAEAFTDVLRLAQGMTHKASISGLKWGGGKAVIMGDPTAPRPPGMMERFGEFVNRLGGHYITAKDVGTTADDLRKAKSKTRHVLGIDGEPGTSGDPSPATAWGVYHGMRSCAQFAFQSKSLKGLKIALQGLGSVSTYLLDHLIADGAKVTGCDVNASRVDAAAKKYGIEVVSPDAIYDVDCDIFSPAALGASITSKTLPRIRAKVIAGPANNQLETPQEGLELTRRGMVYAPDFAINAGGLINIYYEDPAQGGYTKAKAYDHVSRIEKIISDILERARAEKVPTSEIAIRIAEERIQKESRNLL